jgi:phage-related protein
VHKINFYKDKNGKEPVNEYLQDLAKRNDKDSRIKLNKIQDYIQILSEYGTKIGEPYIKHLEGEIWELRPIRDRILFAGRVNDGFLLLHHFMKKTQKTPKREIDQAKRNLVDFIARSKEDEENEE